MMYKKYFVYKLSDKKRMSNMLKTRTEASYLCDKLNVAYSTELFCICTVSYCKGRIVEFSPKENYKKIGNGVC